MPLLYYIQTIIIGLMITLVIGFHMLRQRKGRSELKSIFVMILLTNMALLLLELLMAIFGGNQHIPTWILPGVICLFYILSPLPEALWIAYLDAFVRQKMNKSISKGTVLVICLPLIINMVLSLGSLSGEYLFYLDTDHEYHRGAYYLLMPAMCYIYLLYYIAMVIIKRKYISIQEFLALLFAALPPLIAGVLQSIFSGISAIWVALTFSLLIVYLNLQREQVYKELINLDRLKDQFLANTSHELRTPLNGIINITNSVLEDIAMPVNTSQRKNLQIVLSEARRLDHLIHDILDISSMQNGKMNLALRAVDLHSVANASLYVISQINEGKAIEFINHISEDMPAVYADEERLYQIFYNLIGNALKFTKQGQIITGAERKLDAVEVWIQDTGIGIPDDKLEDIFTPFYQLDSTETREAGGTGLGLSITRTLVELQGGSLWVQSQPGVGSSFRFTIPLSKKEGEKIYRQQLGEKPALVWEKPVLVTQGIRTERSYSILVADDDPASLAALFYVLDNEGYMVTAVPDGMTALTKLEQPSQYDLVILDVMMPKISGFEVLRAIRQRFQPLDLPVLMVTARTRPEDLQIGFDNGANDYLTKPFESQELRSRVKTLVQLKESVGERISAELSFLQAQIKPHFLFNALSTIAAHSTVEPARAKGLLYDLSDYLRGSFSFEADEDLAPLESELATVRAYVSIEQERFQDRLDMQYDVDDSIECKIPRLIIQPLVENAIRHGIMTRTQGGVVRLSVRREEDKMLIIVEDNGIGMEPEKLQQLMSQTGTRTGVGLMNIERRLTLYYGVGMHIWSHPGQGTIISIHIPMNKEQTTGESELNCR